MNIYWNDSFPWNVELLQDTTIITYITAMYSNVRRCLQKWIRKLMKQKDWGTVVCFGDKGSWLNFSHSRHNPSLTSSSSLTHNSLLNSSSTRHHQHDTSIVFHHPYFDTHTHPHVLYTRFTLHIITRFRLVSSFINKGTIVVVSKSWYPSSTIIIHPKNNSL
jgi:hypothetical protein